MSSVGSFRILITGANGQVGWELRRSLSSFGEITAVDREELDLSQESLVRDFIRDLRPQLIVNAAAYTAVDRAETEVDLCHFLNAEVPRILAEEAKALDAPFITYSTDYVFDGESAVPYTEESTPNPLSIYGRSKLNGDLAVRRVGGAHLIFRTSWVYGARGNNFLLTMLRLGREKPNLRVVDDQVGSPTWSRDISEATAQVVASIRARANNSNLSTAVLPVSGIYNLVASGNTSWFGFAKAIFEEAGLPVSIVPISTAEYPTPARRPKSSRLSTQKLSETFGICLPDWRVSLAEVLKSLTASSETVPSRPQI